MRAHYWQAVVSALFVVVAAPAPGGAQIPDEFQNLQVFPAGIDRGELLSNMRNFSFALGVRCQYCHVGEGDDLSRFDFITDTKPTKRIAREMLRMVERINTSTLPGLEQHGKDPQNLVTVRCITCHRGQPRPLLMEEVLREVLDSDGVEAAQERYRTLRESYYGDFTYDFSETTIREFGFALLQEDRPAEARAFLQLTLSYFPESSTTWYYLGQVYEKLEDVQKAAAAYRKVLELRPGHVNAVRRLDTLGIPPARR